MLVWRVGLVRRGLMVAAAPAQWDSCVVVAAVLQTTAAARSFWQCAVANGSSSSQPASAVMMMVQMSPVAVGRVCGRVQQQEGCPKQQPQEQRPGQTAATGRMTLSLLQPTGLARGPGSLLLLPLLGLMLVLGPGA
jgi:carbon starvation protein CstA